MDRHMTDKEGSPRCGLPLRAVRHTTAFAWSVSCPGCAESLDVEAALARALKPPATARDLYKALCLRLLKVGFEARTLLYFGMTLAHMGVRDCEYDPREVAHMLAARGYRFPPHLHPYVTDFRNEAARLYGAD